MDLGSLLGALLLRPQKPVIKSPEMPIAAPEYESPLAEALIKLSKATGGNFDSPEMRQLMQLTRATESQNGKFNKQFGANGVAIGPYQIEPKTERDIWDNFLEFHPKTKAYVGTLKRDLNDPIYNATMARLKYARRGQGEKWSWDNIGKNIPSTVPEQAKYWAKHYNTKASSKGINKAIEDYNKYYGK